MSEDEVCRVWCLIDSEQTAFSINANLGWDVEELKDAIQRRRTRLKTIDIIDLVLWKVRLSYSGVNVVLTRTHKLNDPIPVPDDDDDTLPQLLSKPITSFSVKLNKLTQKLSDALPYLPENHLHIIVQLPGKQIYGHLSMGDCQPFLRPYFFCISLLLHAIRRHFLLAIPHPGVHKPLTSSCHSCSIR